MAHEASDIGPVVRLSTLSCNISCLLCKLRLSVIMLIGGFRYCDFVIYHLLQDSEILKCSSLNGACGNQVQYMAVSINSLLIDLKSYFGLKV